MYDIVSKIDLKILKLIDKKGIIPIKKIENHFYKLDGIVLRLTNLRDNGFIAQPCDKVINGVLIRAPKEPVLYLTDKGKLLLQENAEKISTKFIKWLFNNWIALLSLIVAFIALLKQ